MSACRSEKEKQGSPQVLERISKSIVGTRRFCYSLDKLVCRRLAYNGDHHLQGNAAASLKLAHQGADELHASCPRMDSHQVPWQHCRKKSSAASCLYGGTTHRGSHDGIKSLLPRLNTQPAERAPNCPTSQIPNFPTALGSACVLQTHRLCPVFALFRRCPILLPSRLVFLFSSISRPNISASASFRFRGLSGWPPTLAPSRGVCPLALNA